MSDAARFRWRGFTLLEMLVVLVILALVAQTAIVAVDGLVDGERRAASVRALENAEQAIVGRRGVLDPSGRAWIEGFVADVGRLPRPSSAGELDELWIAPGSVEHYAAQPVSGSELPGGGTLTCGWRGPYLRLPLGDTTFTDGWARPFVLSFDAAASPAPRLSITSLGADGVADGVPVGGESIGYAADLELDLVAANYCGVFTVDWSPKLAGDEILVEIWRPVDGAATAKSSGWIAATSGAIAYTLADQIAIGHHVLVVATRVTGSTALKKIVKRPITVVALGIAGGDPLIDLESP
jgi:prepilin-type N-terminal cleavage/methylation domain-containing protein